MRKPWEESGSHRDDFGFEDYPRRSDRRFDDRDGSKRRSDRRFDRREDRFGRREEGSGRFDRRRDDRRGGFAKRRDEFADNVYGVRSGPRARAAMASRGAGSRRQAAPSRNALITLDADVARVFATSEAVNAALRHLIALADIMGVDAIKQAQTEAQKDPSEQEENQPQSTLDSVVETSSEIQTTDDDEEWFDLPVEKAKTE